MPKKGTVSDDLKKETARAAHAEVACQFCRSSSYAFLTHDDDRAKSQPEEKWNGTVDSSVAPFHCFSVRVFSSPTVSANFQGFTDVLWCVRMCVRERDF